MPAPLRLRLLALPDAMPGSLFAALDVASVASRIAAIRSPDEPARIDWEVISPSGRAVELPFAARSQPPRMRLPRVEPVHSVLVLPSLQVNNAPQLDEVLARSATALKLVARHAAEGGWIAACATGVVLAARAGLLDGSRVPAPWAYQSWLARRFPRVDFSSDEPFGAIGRAFNCVAPALMTEFMLRVLGHVHDPDLAQACSRVMLHQPERQQLTPGLVEGRWLARTADSPVYRAMQWLQAHVDQPYRLSEVASAAAASERTLLRHFRQVTGITPLAYLHALRIERAKMLIEVTLHGVQGVAEACGYRDAAAFRRLFLRETGLSMSDWRRRYALRSRRSFWRVEDARRRPRVSP